jgi:lipopolysaccharide transport system permease protein
VLQNFLELWRYRTLITALVVRYLSMRYRGSILGFFWSFLNPLCLMLVYTLVFKFYMRFDVENYAIFLFCGLLPWLWVTGGLSEGTSAIVAGGNLITKSMFPAQILPTVSILTNMIHFLLALPLLFVFMLIAGMPIHLTALALPLIIFLQFLILHGAVLFLSALNVKYRDVQHVVGNLLTFLFFLCPIIYPVSQVPERFQITLKLNPFAALTVCYHNLILEGVFPQISTLVCLLVSAIFALFLGNLVFNRCREGFAEML